MGILTVVKSNNSNTNKNNKIKIAYGNKILKDFCKIIHRHAYIIFINTLLHTLTVNPKGLVDRGVSKHVKELVGRFWWLVRGIVGFGFAGAVGGVGFWGFSRYSQSHILDSIDGRSG